MLDWGEIPSWKVGCMSSLRSESRTTGRSRQSSSAMELEFAMVNGETLFGPESSCETNAKSIHLQSDEPGPGERIAAPDHPHPVGRSMVV